MLVGVTVTPAEAASACDDGSANTTWVGPATEGGSVSWAESSNWSNGAPTAASVVCIPATPTGPTVQWSTHAVADVIDADGAAVTVEGHLTVGTRFDVASLVGEFGELHGPGTTTVTGVLTGDGLTLQDAAEVDLLDGAVLDGEVSPGRSGGRLEVLGAVDLGSATVDSLGGNPFTITESGSLTVDGGHASVIGGFANHGLVHVISGDLMMLGAGDEAAPDEFSTGAFIGDPDAEFFNVAYTELRDGALLDHVTFVNSLVVPAESTVTTAATDVWDAFEPGTPPSLLGEGELVVTDGSVADARIGGSLTVTVPAGEAFTMGPDGTLEDRVHLHVFGQVAQSGELFLQDETKVTLEGPGASLDGLAAMGNGPHSTVDLRGGADLAVPGRFRNEGTLQLSSGSRLDVGGKFRQMATGALVTSLDETGRGRVRAAGPRDLAGALWIDRDPAYKPPVGTVLNFITSAGAKSADDAFDKVGSPRYGTTRKIQPTYDTNHVRLRVDRVS
jgi:hypothetical protein